MPEFNQNKLIALCKDKRVLLLCHENADLDSFCSAAIMQRFLDKQKINSKIAIPSHINEQAQHLALTEKVSFILNPQLEEFDVALLFDLNGFEQLGKLRDKFVLRVSEEKLDVVVFDHHVSSKGCISYKGNCMLDETAVSTTELLYNFLDIFDNKMSFFCCIGILEDTGHFLVGSARAFSSFATCLKSSKRTYSDVLSFTKHEIPDSERIAFLKAAGRAQIQVINEIVVVTSELSFYQSAAATKLLSFGAHIALVAGEEKNSLTTLSLRAETEFKEKHNFNLVKDLLIPLQKEIGGEIGGHSGAAQWKGKVQAKLVLNSSINILKKVLR
ncbi:MAG: DHH family phosphoesterase [archaeon]|jgi:nanoRNase/pAp phosphatase (c-di-AMP/oligoRNAs hydrolase)